jgi:hypothetical protein
MIALTLPDEGLDLRHELLSCQSQLLEQALRRTDGDRVQAAKLLRTDPLSLERLRRFLAPVPPPIVYAPAGPAAAATSAPPASEAPTRTDLTRPRPYRERPYRDCRVPAPPPIKLDPTDLGRIDGGVMKITRTVIRRLNAEGLTPRQIGSQLGVNAYFVEKVLRCEAELAKCGSKREPERE